MNPLLEALNHPVNAFQKGSKAMCLSLLLTTVLLNSIFEPVLRHFCGVTPFALNAAKMIRITVLGLIAYLVICIAFWLVCKAFGSKATFAAHLKGWGMTYFPTALCAVAVAITEVFFYVFWNNTAWGMLLNFVFVGILVWKFILFIIYIREFAELKGWRFLGALVAMSIIILTLAAFEGYLGLKTPIL